MLRPKKLPLQRHKRYSLHEIYARLKNAMVIFAVAGRCQSFMLITSPEILILAMGR